MPSRRDAKTELDMKKITGKRQEKAGEKTSDADADLTAVAKRIRKDSFERAYSCC